jgi:hypothetical protein
MTSAIIRSALFIALALVLTMAARGAELPAGYDAGQLYNLGNAYARAGQSGLAVLSYERARLLSPTDADIEANLRRVREAAHVSAETRSNLEFLRLPSSFLVAGLILAGLTLGAASGLAWRRKIMPQRWLAAGALTGASMMGLAAGNALLVWPKLHSAVIIAAQTPVRAAPVPLGDALFVLAEAETVKITAEHADFVLVSTALGRTGWVAQAAVAPIVPRP